MKLKLKKQDTVKAEKVSKTLTKVSAKNEKKGALNIFVQTGKGFKKVLKSIKGYFLGAWHELKQVRWPNRRATWGLTGAVILFTAFFLVLIVLLDTGFDLLFKLIIK